MKERDRMGGGGRESEKQRDRGGRKIETDRHRLIGRIQTDKKKRYGYSGERIKPQVEYSHADFSNSSNSFGLNG